MELTVDIVEIAERRKHFNEGELILLTRFFNKRSSENHNHRSDLIQ